MTQAAQKGSAAQQGPVAQDGPAARAIAEAEARREQGGTATAAMLKNDIDSGRTGEKVAVLDVGAAPLGTCEEASGTPLTPQQLHQLREMEVKTPDPVKPGQGQSEGRTWIVPIVAVVVVLAVVVLAVVALR